MRAARKSAMVSLATAGLLSGAIAVVALSGCGGGSGGAASAKLDASEFLPPRPAPEIALRDWSGRPVRLSRYRGKAVLLTFIYDHCPDTCPLIVSKLHQTLVELGSKASDVKIVAVSVDPVGDTPATVKKFLIEHQMLGRMDYLIGSRRQLVPFWKAYGVGVGGTPESREDPARRAVSHTAVIYGITGSGKELTLYDQLFKPSEAAHDVPLLASR
jgi:protein SCO1/2